MVQTFRCRGPPLISLRSVIKLGAVSEGAVYQTTTRWRLCMGSIHSRQHYRRVEKNACPLVERRFFQIDFMENLRLSCLIDI